MAYKERKLIELLAARGNIQATLILELLNTCQTLGTFEVLADIDQAMSIDPDTDDILNSVTEDILNELLPTILKMTSAPMADTFEGLSFHVSIAQRLHAKIFSYWSWHHEWPTMITISNRWKKPSLNMKSYTYREKDDTPHIVQVEYASHKNLEKMDFPERATQPEEGEKQKV